MRMLGFVRLPWPHESLLHHSPREFGKPTSLWTLSLAAEVAFEQGLTGRQLSYESIRQALKRLGAYCAIAQLA